LRAANAVQDIDPISQVVPWMMIVDGTNFLSFRDRVDVDLVVNQRAPDTDWVATCATGQRVSKVAGAIGANGSGKTALL